MPFSPDSQTRRIENILTSISDCFCALDANWCYVYINRQAEEFFGRARDEMLGRSLWELYPELCDSIFERELKRVAKSGRHSHFVAPSPVSRRWVDVRVSPIVSDLEFPDAGGGVSLYFRDVTGEREARQNANFYRLLVENAREYGILAFDLDGHITHWNTGAERIFGWSEDEVRGQKSDLIFTPEDRQRGAPEQEIETARREGRAQDERWHLRRDDSRFWAEGAMMRLDDDEGLPRGFVKILRDNTEKRAAQNALSEGEERLRQVTDQVGVALWTWEPDADIIHYEIGMTELYGFAYSSFAELVPHLHPDDAGPLAARLRAMEPGTREELLFRASSAPGSAPWKWIRANITVSRTPDGRRFMSGTNADVTAQHETERALHSSQRRLDNVVRETGAGVWSWNPANDELLEEINLEAVTGITPFSMGGLREAIHPADWPTVEKTVERALMCGEGYEFEHRVALFAGADPEQPSDWRWLSARAVPNANEAGDTIFSGFVFDITSRKSNEAALAQSRQQLDNVVRAANLALWVWSPARDEILESVNLEAIFEMNRISLRDVLECAHPDDRVPIETIVSRAVQNAEPFEIELRVGRRAGNREPTNTADWKWILVTSNANPDERGELFYSGFAFDITSRKEAEVALAQSRERLEDVTRASQAALWVWNPQTREFLDQVNLPGLFGEPTRDAPEGFDWRIHPRDSAEVDARVEQAITNEEPQEFEFRVARCEGANPNVGTDWRWVLVSLSPQRDERGEIIISGLTFDISARKEAELSRLAVESRYQTLVQASAAMVFRTTPDGRRLDAPRWLEWTGQTQEEVTDFGWMERLPAGDRERIMREWGQALVEKRPVELSYRMRYRDGQLRHVHVRVVPILDERGELVEWLGTLDDVHDEIEAQNAVRDREARYAALVNASTTMIWRTSPTGDFLDSTGWMAYTGQSASECAGLGWFNAIDERDRERVQREWAEAVEQQAPLVTLNYRVRHHSGLSRHCLVRGVPVRDEEGRIIEWVGTLQDIHDDIEAQEAVRQSEARYAALVRASAAIVWRGSPDLAQVQTSGWAAYTGDEGEEIGSGQWLAAIHPDDHGRSLAIWADLFERPRTAEFHQRLLHRSGQYRHCLTRVVPLLDEEGQLREWLGAVADVNDQIEAENAVRESEERYAALVRASAVVVWRGAPDLSTVHATGWANYTGDDKEEVGGGEWLNVVHPHDRARAMSDWNDLFAHPRTAELRQRLRHKSGQFRHCLVRVVPLFDEEGGVREWIGTIIDVNDRVVAEELRDKLLAEEKRARRLAEDARREAERANTMKDEFLAVVSHELRTPLNAILGWSHLLQSGELPPEAAREGLAVIERNARSQAQIVEDILDVARIVTGKLRVEKLPVDLETVARGALDATQGTALAKGVVLESQIASLSVVGDPVRLRQVLWNLLSNAIKFSPSGGRVQFVMSREGNFAVLEVRDEGVGIASEFLPHVFDRFRQADSSSTRRHGGLGLGLALVRSIVEAHGGHVEALSQGEGLGATFRVQIPLAPSARIETPEIVAAARGDQLDGVRVLVCDDVPDTLDFVRFVLEREGARVQVAATVGEARQRLEDETFDILLSDIALPDEDGFVLLDWTRRNRATMPVVAMTAFTGEAQSRRIQDAGFVAIVSKPTEANVLIATVAQSVVKANVLSS